MTSEHNGGKLKSGDHVMVDLANGHTLEILVYENQIFVKSNMDDLKVTRSTSFGVYVKQIPRGSDLTSD